MVKKKNKFGIDAGLTNLRRVPSDEELFAEFRKMKMPKKKK